MSVKKGGEQEEESELLSSVKNFRRELNLLLLYLQTFEDLVMATSQTAAFWNLYLKLVQLLRDYVSAERDSNILLHLETFAEMLPFDFICNHQNYASWGSVYITEMHKLQTDHKDVFQNFLTGQHSIHKADKDENKFSGVWSDIAIEKDRGKLGGPTSIKTRESAMERWYLTAHLKANVATQFLKYSGLDLTPDKIYVHKEATENRTRQDEDAVMNIIKVIEEEMTNPFSRGGGDS